MEYELQTKGDLYSLHGNIYWPKKEDLKQKWWQLVSWGWLQFTNWEGWDKSVDWGMIGLVNRARVKIIYHGVLWCCFDVIFESKNNPHNKNKFALRTLGNLEVPCSPCMNVWIRYLIFVCRVHVGKQLWSVPADILPKSFGTWRSIRSNVEKTMMVLAQFYTNWGLP